MKQMDSKDTCHPYGALINLSLIAFVLMHIVGKTWIRGMAYSADWWLSNLIDTAVRPVTLPVLLMALGAIAKREHQKEGVSFRKKLMWFVPFLAASAVYIFIYGRYDEQPFDFKIAGMLFTAAYAYYWVPLGMLFCLAAAPFCLWLKSRKNGGLVLSVFMICWFILSVAIPSIDSYSGNVDPNRILKCVVNTVDRLMAFKLSGFFVVGLLYSEDLLEAGAAKKSALFRVLTSPYTLLALYAIAFSIPVVEAERKMHHFDHSLRDYTKLHQALLGLGLYLKLASAAAAKMGKVSEFLARYGSVITGLYLASSALIEVFVTWIPSTPITGLIIKTAALMTLGVLCGIVYHCCERAIFSEEW